MKFLMLLLLFSFQAISQDFPRHWSPFYTFYNDSMCEAPDDVPEYNYEGNRVDLESPITKRINYAGKVEFSYYPLAAYEWIAKKFPKDFTCTHHENNLKTEEILSLLEYTGGGFLDLNDGLWRNRMTPDLEYVNFVTKNALNKLPKYKGLVFRRAFLEGQDLIVGKEIIFKGFASCSTRDDLNHAGILMKINSITGRDISKYSVHPGEQEVLLLAGSKLIIRKIIKSDRQEIVEIELDQVL